MAKKNVSSVVSGMGLGLSILEGLVVAIRKEGGTDDDIHRLATADGRMVLANMAKLAVIRKDPDSYTVRFAAAIAAGGFTWWNQERLTAWNFPGETFEGGDYDLEWRPLSSKSDGYTGDEIDAIVAKWAKVDASILGSASAGDGLFLAKEFKAGRRDQPNGWIVCPGSTSVGRGLLYLHRDGTIRKAGVYSRSYRWGDDDFVLLRKVRKP